MTATAAIDFEVGDVDGHHFAVPPFLGHRDQAGVGKVHRLIGILANQFADPGVVFTEVPRADQEAISHCRQDWIRVAKKMRHFSENRFAGVQRPGYVAQHVLGPGSKPRFFARQCGDQRARVEEVDHPLCLRRRAKARRMFALVGAGTATSADPRCRSQGDWLAACARWRTAPRTYSATLSLAAAAASSHRAFSSAGTRMVSVSLMSAVSHSRVLLSKRERRSEEIPGGVRSRALTTPDVRDPTINVVAMPSGDSSCHNRNKVFEVRTSTKKSLAQVLALLQVLTCDVDLVVRTKTA